MLTQQQEDALKIMGSGRNVFLTGYAGTGKSYLIKEFIKKLPQNKYALTGTTGISALNIGGKTIHSWAGIGLGEGDIINRVLEKKFFVFRWRRTRVLIIDEVSMLSPELFDKLEELARTVRNSNKPFGGMQLVLVGDFCQLPVVKSTKFCFQSEKWDKCIDEVVHLNEIIRQSDTEFCDILRELRLGICSQKTIDKLKQRVIKDIPDKNDIKPTILFSTNKRVDNINNSELNKLIDEGHELIKYNCKATVVNSKLTKIQVKNMVKHSTKNMDEISVCIGCQVMITANINFNTGLVNGTRGIITGFKMGLPEIKLLNGNTHIVDYHERKIIDDKTHISIKYIPLKLAWATTIHKSQGSTLDYVVTNLNSNSIFEYGQAYVALSRVRNLDGLFLEDVDNSSFICHPLIVEYYSKYDKSIDQNLISNMCENIKSLKLNQDN